MVKWGQNLCVLQPQGLALVSTGLRFKTDFRKILLSKEFRKHTVEPEWFHNKNDSDKHLFLSLFEESCTYIAL